MAICVSKGVTLVCMISFLVCLHLTRGSDATDLSYGAIGRNSIPGCSRLRPQNCVKLPTSNPYQRGCEHVSRCRDHPAPPGIGDDSDGDNKEVVVDHYHYGKKKQNLKTRRISYNAIPSPKIGA